MGLRLILGRSGYGKTELCFTEIIKKLEGKEDGASLIYIVPEQSTLQAERELILRTKGHGSIRAQVLSFQRLAYHIFLEAGRSKRKTLEDIGKSMLLRKIVYDLRDELLFFRNVSGKQGFMDNLSAIITEFFRYDLSPEKLSAVSEQIQGNEPLKLKTSDLYKIYVTYLDILKKDYISDDQVLDLLAEMIPEADSLKSAEIWIDGFNGFTPQEYKVIGRLLSQAEAVHITLCVDEAGLNGDNFQESGQTSRKLVRLAEELKLAPAERLFLKTNYRFTKSKELDFLEKNYFQSQTLYKGEVKDIHILVSQNMYSEITDTAKAIRNLLMNEGYHYRDIAVVACAMEEYEKILKGVFRKFSIPLFIDSKVDILSHPLTELIRGAVDIAAKNWSYESVFRFLKTDLSGLDKDEVDRVENFVLANGIRGSRWKSDWYGADENMNGSREKILEVLRPFTENLYASKKMTVRELSGRIFDMLYAVKITDTLEKWIEENIGSGNEQIWEKIVQVFDKMVEILGDKIVTVSEYARVLDAGLETADMGLIPPIQDSVIVGDLERSRLPAVKALFVLGVNEGIIPSAKSEQGIFSDEERQQMKVMNIELAPDNRQQAFYEDFLIYCGLTKPSEFLQLSYHIGNLDGKAKLPSPLIGRMKRMFPALKEITGEFYGITAAAQEFRTLAEVLRRYTESGEISDVYRDVYTWFYRDAEYHDKLLRIQEFLLKERKQEKLETRTLKKLYGAGVSTSASRLERFVECPFSYFIEYTLGAKERKLYQMENFDIGTLFHNIIEAFFSKAEKEKMNIKDMTKEEVDALAIESVRQVYEESYGGKNNVMTSTDRNRYFLARVEKMSRRTIWALSEHIKMGEFVPSYNEFEFQEITVELGDGIKMYISGRIDRADILELEGEKFVKVIDYKSGDKKLDLEEIFYGKQLQLVLYMDLLIKKLSATLPLSSGAVLYFRIDNPMIEYEGDISPEDLEKKLLREFKMSGLMLKNKEVILALDKEIKTHSIVVPAALVIDKDTKEKVVKDSPATLEKDEFDAVRRYVSEKIRRIGQEIAEGTIDVRPYRYGNRTGCDYCRLRAVCQADIYPENELYQVFKKFESKQDVLRNMNREVEEKGEK